MKMNYLNKNNNIALSKRTKSGDKDKFQTIKNSKFQYNQKYMSYFNSPKKGENVLFMKKKFQKIKKNSGEKIKSEIIQELIKTNSDLLTRVDSLEKEVKEIKEILELNNIKIKI